MENTTYGRKVIRNKVTQKQVKRRFLIFTITVLLIGMLLGSLVTMTVSAAEAPSTHNDDTMQDVKEYGTYDGKVFTSEMSIDWSGDEFEFIPLDCDLDEETQQFIFYLCKGYDMDWTLVMAVIQKESAFKPDVISSTGDYGLMQINQTNHEWLTETIGVTDFLDKEQNIRAGVFILRKLFEKYTDNEQVLMAYNMGEKGASKLWNEGIYSTSYSEDIIKIQEGFIKQLEGADGNVLQE